MCWRVQGGWPSLASMEGDRTRPGKDANPQHRNGLRVTAGTASTTPVTASAAVGSVPAATNTTTVVFLYFLLPFLDLSSSW